MRLLCILTCLLACCVLVYIPQTHAIGDDSRTVDVSDEELVAVLSGSDEDTKYPDAEDSYEDDGTQSDPRIEISPPVFASLQSAKYGSAPADSTTQGGSAFGYGAGYGSPSGFVAGVYGYGAGYGSRRSILSTDGLPQKCYCQYNANSNTWMLGQPSCREALYKKCDSDPQLLSCSQLDTYYLTKSRRTGGVPQKSAVEQQIFAFLKKDCSPPVPCACAALHYDNTDSAADVTQCCVQLASHCQQSFTGLSCGIVHGFCRRRTYQRDVLEWVVNVTRDSSCPTFATLESYQDRQQSSLTHLVWSWLPASRKSLPILLLAGALGGCVGSIVTVIVFLASRRSTSQPPEFITSA